MLTDKFGRRITYLRVSLTDRCNLKCAYCLPHNYRWMEREKLLSLEEIERVVRAASQFGITKVRITGGEPLLRKDILWLIEKLSHLPVKLYMTTNGILLSRYAKALHNAGLQGLNVSVDSLKPEKFSSITGGGNLAAVLEGIKKAHEAGFSPVKVNVVAIRGINCDEVPDFLHFSKQTGVVIRFIEYMPFAEKISPHSLFSREEILHAAGFFIDKNRAPSSVSGNVATYYPLAWGGEFGIISPVTCRFCSMCNRLRLTSDGYLKPCLGANIEVNIKDALRNGYGEKELQALFQQAILMKPAEGSYEHEDISERPMVCVGG